MNRRELIGGKRMDYAYLADADLLHLVWEGGEASYPAVQELERRHFPAVRAFAAVSAAGPQAVDELAYQAWHAALRQQVDSGAVRPRALSSVLRTASGWVRGNHRVVLNPQLAAWIETNGPVMLGNTATAGFRTPSLVARAFAGLPFRSQTILWHQKVEHDDIALIAGLIGTGPEEVSVFSGAAQGELYNGYVQILREGMSDECRRYHRLVLAYAESRSSNIEVQVAPHLDRCPRCAQAVADLGGVRHECGTLLGQALLPWGGADYAVRAMNERAARENSMPGAGSPGLPGIPGAPALRALPAGSQTSEPLVPDYAELGSQGIDDRATGTGRHAALGAEGLVPRKKGRRRTELVVRGVAAAGVFAVGTALAFSFVGDSTTEEPQSKGTAPSAKAELPSPPAKSRPSPSRSDKARSTARSIAKPTSKPSKSKPEPSQPSKSRPAPPASVDNASVEWLFNKVSGSGVTPDSSDNNKDGTLFGAARPRPVNGGALAFDGQQFVGARGPLVDTSGSFTVSARVKLDRTDFSQTVVSQDATDSSAFMLQYDAGESQWEMRIPGRDSSDAEGDDADEATSASKPEAGEWTHLTGVYDDADNEVRLYVDGRLGETVSRKEDFKSEGTFAVGRALSNNEFFQGVDGTIDDVRAFGRAVSSAEAKTLARKS